MANSRLFRAAVEFGLDRYIIYKGPTQQKWRPMYVEDLLANPPPANATRTLATKTLADVVEALIGAAYLSGGIPKALECMALFLPEVEWQPLERCREVLYDEAPAGELLPVTMRRLEELVGYTFTRKALLVEAMTHPSCNQPGVRASLDRLEFLGDAVLDYVVVQKLYQAAGGKLENWQLHLMLTALVNADVLGFLVMEWDVKQERVDVVAAAAGGEETTSDEQDEGGGLSGTGGDDDDGGGNGSPRLVRSEVSLPLWSFMRHASADMGVVQRATAQRHAAMRARILEALWEGDRYPWALLARLQANKFYSDVFESVLGAVWVDSGSMDACVAVVERVGILPLMRRLLAGRVHLLHPKEELGRLAAGEKVVYEIEVREEEGGEREFRCKVIVGEECLANVRGGVNKEEARARAAEEACQILRARTCRVLKGGMGPKDEMET